MYHNGGRSIAKMFLIFILSAAAATNAENCTKFCLPGDAVCLNLTKNNISDVVEVQFKEYIVITFYGNDNHSFGLNYRDRLVNITSTADSVGFCFLDFKDIDTGSYHLVSNGSLITSTCTITAVKPPMTAEIQPTSGGAALEGHNYTLLCNITSDASAILLNFTWMVNASSVVNHEHFTFDGISNEYLVVNKVTRSDIDFVIQCSVRDILGPPTVSNGYKITVWMKPEFLNQEETIYANIGSNFLTPCKAVGIPIPVVQWVYSDNNILEVQQNRSTAILFIRNVTKSNGGKIRCRAEVANAPSLWTEKYFTIIVRDKPQFPVDVSVTNVTLNRAVIHWRAGDDGGLSQSFVLMYRRMGTDIWHLLELNFPSIKHNLSLILNYLLSDTEYEGYLYSQNSLGSSAKMQLSFHTLASEMPVQNFYGSDVYTYVTFILPIPSFILSMMIMVNLCWTSQKEKKCDKAIEPPVEVNGMETRFSSRSDATVSYRETTQNLEYFRLREQSIGPSLYDEISENQEKQGNMKHKKTDLYENTEIGIEDNKK